MAFTVTELAGAYANSSGNSLGSGDFSWDAGDLLVAFFTSQRSTGAFTLTPSAGTTGLSWVDFSPQGFMEYSIGDARCAAWVCKAASGGTGALSLSTSANTSARCIHVVKVDGADTDGDETDIIRQDWEDATIGVSDISVLTVDSLPSPVLESSLVLSCLFTFQSKYNHDSPFIEVRHDSAATLRGTETAYAVGQTFDEYTTTTEGDTGGGCGVKALEIRGFSVEVPPGAPAERRQLPPRPKLQWQDSPNRFRRP